MLPMGENSRQRPDRRAERDKRLAEALRANLKLRKDSGRRKSAAGAAADGLGEQGSGGPAGPASSGER
jgi:hypothetical protein